jgi:hypothetical protein
MWNQLGVLGSRVVEAVFVSEDHQATGSTGFEDISEGRGVGGTVGAEAVIAIESGHESEGSGVEGTVGAVMEGSDVKTLIAKRMGIPKGEVDTRLISLHQKGELNGTADRSAGPSDRSFVNSGKSPTLTKKDLEDFERAEAEARNGTPSHTGTPAHTGTPFKAFKPAVLNPSATPRTPRTPPAWPAQVPPATTPTARPARFPQRLLLPLGRLQRQKGRMTRWSTPNLKAGTLKRTGAKRWRLRRPLRLTGTIEAKAAEWREL